MCTGTETVNPFEGIMRETQSLALQLGLGSSILEQNAPESTILDAETLPNSGLLTENLESGAKIRDADLIDLDDSDLDDEDDFGGIGSRLTALKAEDERYNSKRKKQWAAKSSQSGGQEGAPPRRPKRKKTGAAAEERQSRALDLEWEAVDRVHRSKFGSGLG